MLKLYINVNNNKYYYLKCEIKVDYSSFLC